jgi:threonine/homoserine/homoserine lactone efflux protein
VAELGAYLISLSLLVFVVVPASQSHSAISHVLHLVCSAYLVYVAFWLWRSGEQEIQTSHPITFSRVFLTTLVNPKNLIFAFGIFPATSTAPHGMLPYLSGFSVICTGVGCCWIAAGMLLHSTGAPKPHLNWLYRGEACLLVGFAVLILFSAYY